ncbi:DNA polymerase III subunit delta [Candidatus Gracilibacteria bacterium]|nr:DNA polymerase III subunit delta [Candidatus Gracilibacteria bacterium]PIQ11105.1 MAG: DNA polymerase III subunit delta [Candidatus Gracilibacteria bacterium CG18_big_fil_WC_8_21_14_2_50_38_16]PIQ41371.1 MAG: DNA polymerase III subunit delta [Candidatus Gracilibacteria bacterium CG12_big_fil_rev_8_21_14_0_65_38_15]
MSRSNIVFFTGSNHIFLRRDLDAWIDIFAKKYGEYNISRLDRETLLKTNIQAELLTPVFLGEKRLIVLEDVPFPTVKGDNEEEKTEETVSKTPDVEAIILAALDQVPETTVVLFVSTEPDKRKSLYKRLIEVATLKEYSNLEGNALREYIRKKLPHIDITALSRFIEYTGADINRIESEIDKLALYKQDGWITEEDIKSTVIPTIETSIFSLTDALFLLDSALAYRELLAILETHNIHYVFSTLQSTLRTFLYASKLLSMSYEPSNVQSLLKIHPYAFEKMRKNMRHSERIKALFSTFVILDKQTKTGEGIGDTDDALRLGLEKAILCLQKN